MKGDLGIKLRRRNRGLRLSELVAFLFFFYFFCGGFPRRRHGQIDFIIGGGRVTGRSGQTLFHHHRSRSSVGADQALAHFWSTNKIKTERETFFALCVPFSRGELERLSLEPMKYATRKKNNLSYNIHLNALLRCYSTGSVKANKIDLRAHFDSG